MASSPLYHNNLEDEEEGEIIEEDKNCSICRSNVYGIDEFDTESLKFVTGCGHTFHKGCWNKYYDNKLNKIKKKCSGLSFFDEWFTIKCPNCRAYCFEDGTNIDKEEYIDLLCDHMTEKTTKLSFYENELTKNDVHISKLQHDYANLKTNYQKMCEYIALLNVNDTERLSQNINQLRNRNGRINNNLFFLNNS